MRKRERISIWIFSGHVMQDANIQELIQFWQRVRQWNESVWKIFWESLDTRRSMLVTRRWNGWVNWSEEDQSIVWRRKSRINMNTSIIVDLVNEEEEAMIWSQRVRHARHIRTSSWELRFSECASIAIRSGTLVNANKVLLHHSHKLYSTLNLPNFPRLQPPVAMEVLLFFRSCVWVSKLLNHRISLEFLFVDRHLPCLFNRGKV